MPSYINLYIKGHQKYPKVLHIVIFGTKFPFPSHLHQSYLRVRTVK
jgi:hypothetical protein